MGRNILEKIRRVLMVTVLPLKKKRDAYLEKMRLSIVYLISLNYLKYIIIYSTIFFIGFGFLYMQEEYHYYEKIADSIVSDMTENIKQMESESDTICSLDDYQVYKDMGITFCLRKVDSENMLFTNLKDYSHIKRYFNNIIVNEDKVYDYIFIEKEIVFEVMGSNYVAEFQFNLTDSYHKLIRLYLGMILLYAVIVLFIMKGAKQGDHKIFEPLRNMTSTANKLTINNLHSERINVEGTKNELKDLANVINEMLGRIENSYESQKQFVSDASHELRTPIAVIQGYANLLNRWGTKDEAVMMESIEAIKNEAGSMQDLVEKLLFLSRHDKKTLKMDKKHFNMRPIVEDMVKETKLVSPNRVILSPKIENVIVYGDKQSLKQAIRIFIDNAIKYSRDGDTITITCENVDKDCIITVSDTGIGMTRQDIDHIFDRFYRSDYVRNNNISGHGLGLSLAKLIILGHVGKIKVRSQYTKGTTFTITLPYRDFY